MNKDIDKSFADKNSHCIADAACCHETVDTGCMSICLSVCLSVCPSVCLSACLLVCLPACLPVSVCADNRALTMDLESNLLLS